MGGGGLRSGSKGRRHIGESTFSNISFYWPQNQESTLCNLQIWSLWNSLVGSKQNRPLIRQSNFLCSQILPHNSTIIIQTKFSNVIPQLKYMSSIHQVQNLHWIEPRQWLPWLGKQFGGEHWTCALWFLFPCGFRNNTSCSPDSSGLRQAWESLQLLWRTSVLSRNGTNRSLLREILL